MRCIYSIVKSQVQNQINYYIPYFSFYEGGKSKKVKPLGAIFNEVEDRGVLDRKREKGKRQKIQMYLIKS